MMIKRGAIRLTTYSALELLLYTSVAGYILLNTGFSQLRIPPESSYAIPIGEIVLLIALIVISARGALLQLFFRFSIAPLFLAWWLLAFATVSLAIPDYGIWAIRSATHAIESLYIMIGITVGAYASTRERFFRFWDLVLSASFIYAMTAPFHPLLAPLSPTITALAGYTLPLFFNYAGLHIYTLMFAARSVLTERYALPTRSHVFALVAVLVTLIAMQNRTSYGIMFVLLILVAYYYPRKLPIIGIAGGLILGILALMFTLGIELSGRISEVKSIDFFIRHFMSSFGIAGEGVVGAAAGVYQRLNWWAAIFDRILSTPGTLLFGLGHGSALTDLKLVGGVLVREPHNSLVSMFARYGLIGFIIFLWIHLLLYRRLLLNIRIAGACGDHEERRRLVMMLFFFLSVTIFSMVEDGLEKPMIAIPYYLAWGVVITPPRPPYSYSVQ